MAEKCKNAIKYMRSGVLVAVIMKIIVICDVILCSLVMYTDHIALHARNKIHYGSYHVVKCH